MPRRRGQAAPPDGRVRGFGEPPRDDWFHDGRGLPVVGDVVHVHTGSLARYWWHVRVVRAYICKYGPRFEAIRLGEEGRTPWAFGRTVLRPTVMTADGPRCVDCGRL